MQTLAQIVKTVTLNPKAPASTMKATSGSLPTKCWEALSSPATMRDQGTGKNPART